MASLGCPRKILSKKDLHASLRDRQVRKPTLATGSVSLPEDLRCDVHDSIVRYWRRGSRSDVTTGGIEYGRVPDSLGSETSFMFPNPTRHSLHAFVVPALATSARAGHPQSWERWAIQRMGHPLAVPIYCMDACTCIGSTSTFTQYGAVPGGTGNGIVLPGRGVINCVIRQPVKSEGASGLRYRPFMSPLLPT